MEQANTNSKPAALPLFRAEALAARQQGTQGEILLIRPLSLVLLGWLGVALAGSAIGILVLAKYTPTQKIEATITGTAPMRGILPLPTQRTKTVCAGTPAAPLVPFAPLRVPAGLLRVTGLKGNRSAQCNG